MEMTQWTWRNLNLNEKEAHQKFRAPRTCHPEIVLHRQKSDGQMECFVQVLVLL